MAGHRSLVTHCVSLVFLTSLWNVGFTLDLSCVGVKKEYNDKMGLRDDTVPISAIPGNHLQVCPQGTTCCTEDMESKLISLSGKEYDTVVDATFKIIKSTFVSRTKKFDDFFTELLEKSKQDLHVMFVRTYGQLYKQNAEMFSDLFDELKHYYKGNNVSLLDILNNFFKGLLERMFELMNAQYLFDEDYMTCVTRNMEDLKPFGDVPSKLKRQVKRAFIAARTFVQGLAIGRDVILAMERVKPTEECRRGLTRMMYCPYCQNLLRTKPCNNYCLNTMKGCLAQHSELNKAWNEYIEALKLVAQRLEGPFNIETVVDPIDVKISEAIMNFQEGQVDVNERIFKGCGTPRMKPAGTKYKREAAASAGSAYEDFYSGEYMNFENRRHSTSDERPDTAAGTNLDKLVKDIKERTEAAKNFWIQLPYMICSGGIAAEQGEEDDCWNGRDRSRYVHPVQKDGRLFQVNNPEVTVDVQEDNGIVSVQIYNLKLITTKLHNAYHGVDVEWTIPEIDVDADVHEGSGTDDVEGSGQQKNRPTGDNSDRKTGDKLEASGDDGIDGSGSGSGDGFDDDDEDIVTYQPHRTNRPPIADPVPYHPDRNENGNPSGNSDRHPPYNVPTTTKKDKGPSQPAGGASCVSVSTSALMTLSMLAVVLYRMVL